MCVKDLIGRFPSSTGLGIEDRMDRDGVEAKPRFIPQGTWLRVMLA